MKKHTHDFGNCHACGAKMDERIVEQIYRVRGRRILMTGVPLGVCRRCGERAAWAPVGKRVNELLRSGRRRYARVATVQYFPSAPAPRRRAAN